MSDSGTTWLGRREHGTILGIRFVLMLCDLLGRKVARGFVRILMLYYTALDRRARAASRGFLERVLGRPVRFRDVLRHLTTFGLVTLDRIFFLRGRRELFEVSARGSEHLDALTASRSGAILLGAHVGSFEALRARGSSRGHDIHILAYLDNAKKINTVLAELDPEMQARVIELGGIDAILRAKEVVESGGLIAMLGDRTGLNEKSVRVPFLGGEAAFPTGPFLLASALRCPVYLVFGVYLEGASYQLWCERFVDRVELPRKDREAALEALVRRYAVRLEEVARTHPYNWFNLFDFWAASPDRVGQVAAPDSVN